MPYWITNQHPDCSGWAVVKEDNELVACQDTKQAAIDNAVAISLAEETEFMGDYADKMDNDERSGMSKIEQRVWAEGLEVREDGDSMTLTGYAAIFNSRSQNLGGFTETILPGAFKRSLRTRNDVKLLWNHDTGAVLGSTRAGTLTLTEDDKGLRVEATLPNTTHGRDARELIKRGDVSAFSFGFSVPPQGDTWNSNGDERVLKSVRLFEVSLVAFPAYQATEGTAAVRSLDKLAQRTEVDIEQLADALTKLESGEDLTTEEGSLITDVVQRLTPQPAQEEPDLTQLNIKLKKLELLKKVI